MLVTFCNMNPVNEQLDVFEQQFHPAHFSSTTRRTTTAMFRPGLEVFRLALSSSHHTLTRKEARNSKSCSSLPSQIRTRWSLQGPQGRRRKEYVYVIHTLSDLQRRDQVLSLKREQGERRQGESYKEKEGRGEERRGEERRGEERRGEERRGEERRGEERRGEGSEDSREERED
eukprot:763630-Hanusia_phi.AAC.3